jgi:ABC-2 type transport system permease protein
MVTNALSRRNAHQHGPSAFGTDLRRFLELTVTIARTDFKLRYFGSVLGYFWQLMRPLLFFGVIYVFFTQILKVDKGVPHYGVYLLTGIVLWTFFGEATGNCVNSLVAREPLLRKVRFPRLAIPLAITMTAIFNLTMNAIAVLVFALANGVTPQLSWLWMAPIVLGFITIALGLGMLLSALYVRFRDMTPIWEVVVQILFYASPIMYVAARYTPYEHLAMLNPFALMLTQMGHAFVHPAPYYVHGVLNVPMRSAYVAAGGARNMVISIAIIPLVFCLGLWFFSREAPHFAENL